MTGTPALQGIPCTGTLSLLASCARGTARKNTTTSIIMVGVEEAAWKYGCSRLIIRRVLVNNVDDYIGKVYWLLLRLILGSVTGAVCGCQLPLVIIGHYCQNNNRMRRKIQTARTLPLESNPQLPLSPDPEPSTSPKKTLSHNKTSRLSRRLTHESVSSLGTSLARGAETSDKQRKLLRKSTKNSESLPSFVEKYLPRGAAAAEVYEEMLAALKYKQREIQSLRVYRDELKFIACSGSSNGRIRISIKLLQDKAEVQSQIKAQKDILAREISQMERQIAGIRDYNQLVQETIAREGLSRDVLDIDAEKQIMIENIRTETQYLVGMLEEQKRKYSKEIKQIQDMIFDLRVEIKEKEDRIRELKARICSLHIKMHGRHIDASRSKGRNSSLSIRKCNLKDSMTAKQIFIGNQHLRARSKQIFQPVEEGNELKKIRFCLEKGRIFLECLYSKGQGLLHHPQPNHKNTMTWAPQCLQIDPQYLLSLRLFFKSRIVGIECRIKTLKGPKSLKIGSCESYVEHELLTLANKRILSLGSHWNEGSLIGVSVWYSEAGGRLGSTNRIIERQNTQDTKAEYYS